MPAKNKREYDRRWYRNNRERYILRNQKWRDNNKAQHAAACAKYYRKNRAKILARVKKWQVDNAEAYLFRQRKRLYGVDQSAWDLIMKKQGGKCAICGTPNGLCVDHSHSNGKVRGILCRNCNAGLGMFGDNPEFIYSAFQYLSKHIP